MGSRSRKGFWVVDAETDPFKIGRVPEPFIWGAYEGVSGEFVTFSAGWEVAEFFRDKKVIVYAHNGGKFDYHYLREYINSDELILLINGRLSKFKIGEAEFRDSLNIFPNTRLEDFGGKIKIDYGKMEKGVREEPNIWSEIICYLRQDCVLLWEMVNRYRESYGTALTQAGASMKVFEKMYEIKAPRQTKAQHDRYKPFYYGGRVQCFEQGIRSCYFSVADINSAYPYAMLSSHPFSTAAEEENELPEDSKIPQCLIKVRGVSHGALPWRDPKSKELFFPDDDGGAGGGVREYCITGWELLAALETNSFKITKIIEVHHFTLTMDFKNYIERFYQLREEARLAKDIAGRTFGKYFMNGLYGKFGANCQNYSEYVIASTDSKGQWEAKGFKEFKPWGDRFLMERAPTEEELSDITGKWRYYNVATSASITGYVRSFLWRSMAKCSGIIYCDTDSITARDVGNLDFGSRLGQWKHEGDFDRYAIAGKKLYAFHYKGAPLQYDPESHEDSGTWKLATKGVNFASLPQGPEILSKIASGEKIIYNSKVPTYSVIRKKPVFIPREIKFTAKDISVAPTEIL